MSKLPLSYYTRTNTLEIAKNLLGKYLITNINGKVTGGIIAETEAYNGVSDKASHAYNGRRTNRTETMYSLGGISYVYFSYGMHYLFNVVTSVKDDPKAVLIRGIIPKIGIEEQMKRRNFTNKEKKHLTNGPAKVCQALGITKNQNGISLLGNSIWIEDKNYKIPKNEIIITSRVGVEYAEEDSMLPYRFIIDNPEYNPVKLRK